MNTSKEKMFGRKVSNLTLILRNQFLEGIIFEMREALKTYKELDETHCLYCGNAADILEKYDKSWDEIYKEINKEIKEMDKNE